MSNVLVSNFEINFLIAEEAKKIAAQWALLHMPR